MELFWWCWHLIVVVVVVDVDVDVDVDVVVLVLFPPFHHHSPPLPSSPGLFSQKKAEEKFFPFQEWSMKSWGFNPIKENSVLKKLS
jgi:hypothetical protein